MSAGWSEEIVDLVIHDAHNITKDKEKIVHYIKYKLSKGTDAESIKQILISIGWNPALVEKLVEKQ